MRLLRRFIPLIAHTRPQPITLRKNIILGTTLLGYGMYSFSQTVKNDQPILTFEIQDNLQEGQVKQVQVGAKVEDTVLVIKYEGKLYCTQSKCAHFGFSLSKGTLSGQLLMCPLHNAGFSIKTGQPNQGPIFNGLQTFPVESKNGKIILKIPKDSWQQTTTRSPLGVKNIDRSKNVTIIGGGPATQSAIDSLRQSGFRGEIIVISKETDGPFDRTMLSKMMDGTKIPSPVRSQEYWKEDGVTLVGGATVKSIDEKAKTLQIEGKNSVKYDKLLIASGTKVRVPPIKGLSNTKYETLRNISDYKSINENIRKEGVKNVTIIGAGFIGLETASAIKAQLKQAVNVTIVEQSEVPLQHVLGKDIGLLYKTLCAKNQITLQSGLKIEEIQSQNGKPTRVITSRRAVDTDVLIMATGVQPSLDFLPEKYIDKETHGVKTNAFLQTDSSDIYACGDIATYPFWYTGLKTRIEHYNEAIYQGSVAGMNLAGKKMPMDNIPFFWTRSFNQTLSFAGNNRGWDQLHVQGSVEEQKFIAYYIRSQDDKVIGAASMGIMNAMQIISEAMRNGVMPKASQVRDKNFTLQGLLAEVKKKKPQCTRCNNCVHQ